MEVLACAWHIAGVDKHEPLFSLPFTLSSLIFKIIDSVTFLTLQFYIWNTFLVLNPHPRSLIFPKPLPLQTLNSDNTHSFQSLKGIWLWSNRGKIYHE